MSVKQTVCRTPSFLLTRDIKLAAKITGSGDVVVIAGLHRQQLGWHGQKEKCFWYLTAFKMKRKALRQNNCFYYWLLTAVCHRERALWPCLMTDPGNITTDEGGCNTGSNSAPWDIQNTGFHRILNTVNGKRHSGTQCDHWRAYAPFDSNFQASAAK